MAARKKKKVYQQRLIDFVAVNVACFYASCLLAVAVCIAQSKIIMSPYINVYKTAFNRQETATVDSQNCPEIPCYCLLDLGV